MILDLPQAPTSQIMSAAEVVQVQEWLGFEAHLELLYCGSRDGWAAADFHRTCDKKGPTLCVFEDVQGFKFGGFTTRDWVSSKAECDDEQCYNADPDAFLFSLRCHSGLPPTKMLVNPNQAQSQFSVTAA